MTSRPGGRSTPRWRTSDSLDCHASLPSRNRTSFRQREHLDSSRRGFRSSAHCDLSMSFHGIQKNYGLSEPSVSVKSQSLGHSNNSSSPRFSKMSLGSYWNHSSDSNTVKPVSPQKSYADGQRMCGRKRSPSHSLSSDCPPSKWVRGMETRRSVDRSNSVRHDDSNVTWSSPPKQNQSPPGIVRRSSRLDLNRDSAEHQRWIDPGFRRPVREQHRSPSHLRGHREYSGFRNCLPSDRRHDDPSRKSSWSSFRRSPLEGRRSDAGCTVNCRDEGRSLELLRGAEFTNRRSSQGSMSGQPRQSARKEAEHRMLKKRSASSERKRCSRDGPHERDAKRGSGGRVWPRSRHGSERPPSEVKNECDPRDPDRQKSKSSMRRSRSSSLASFKQLNDSQSDADLKQTIGNPSSSRSCSPCSGNISVSKLRRSRSRSNSTAVKSEVPEFNPDYVVIMRRSNEGKKPLCSREEFSGTVQPADHHVQESLQEVASSVGEKGQEAHASSVSLCVRNNDLPRKKPAPKTEEKRDKDLNLKHSSASSSESSRAREDLGLRASPVRAPSAGADEFDSDSSPLQETDYKKPGRVPDLISPRARVFDLRQKISEKRLMKFGKISRIAMRRFPNQWRGSFHTGPQPRRATASWSWGRRDPPVIGRRFPFGRNVEPRRSVVLKHAD